MSTKTVWITGASSGIGREFARRYARLGFRLILTARRRDRLETLAAELRAKHGTLCRIVPADLEQDAQVTALCEALADERIDLFINNAGFGACGAFSETDAGKELSMLRVNVLAMHRLFKFTLRKMEAQGFGTILNVASSAGLLPGGPYMAGYYASKAYVVSLTAAWLRSCGSSTARSMSVPSAPAPWTPSSTTAPTWCSPSRASPRSSAWRKPCAECSTARSSSCPAP